MARSGTRLLQSRGQERGRRHRHGEARGGRALAGRAGRRAERHRFGRGASSLVCRLSQQNDGDARHRNRQGCCDCADRRRRRWVRVRRCDAARVRVVRRWHDHDRERGNTAETHGRSDAENRTSCAHDGARSRHASDLFALRTISAAAIAVARRFSSAAASRAEYSQAAGLRKKRRLSSGGPRMRRVAFRCVCDLRALRARRARRKADRR